MKICRFFFILILLKKSIEMEVKRHIKNRADFMFLLTRSPVLKCHVQFG